MKLLDLLQASWIIWGLDAPRRGYRIDLVVESSNGRLAVECDGDRFHSIETVADDMAR